jgi:hypothetical protein
MTGSAKPEDVGSLLRVLRGQQLTDSTQLTLIHSLQQCINTGCHKTTPVGSLSIDFDLLMYRQSAVSKCSMSVLAGSSGVCWDTALEPTWHSFSRKTVTQLLWMLSTRLPSLAAV